MKKVWLEIGLSTGLVLAMIAMILIVQLSLPSGLVEVGFAISLLLFMVAMGLAGIKMADS